MIKGEKYRITVLTDRLIRLEYSESSEFTDGLTQTVFNRDFDETEYELNRDGDKIRLETGSLILNYDGKPFSSVGLSIELKDFGTVWHYGVIFGNSDGNYGGTARTLDETDGFVKLTPGIFGENGYAVLDDSASPVFDGREFSSREDTGFDLYFFGYGRDFLGGLKAFYRLTGKTPMIPRYALGNWWSRYFRYTEESYTELLDRFKEEGIPLSVAVIDMDWHITDPDPKYGTGWTGYTWDKECFPDHRRFLKRLKEYGLKTTLNLHPADGIRAFEAMYKKVCERMGVDPASEEVIEHDLSDPVYRKAYFEDVLHPYEDDGVDFWWIDWQQGTGRKENEVDPLLLLNHFHYKDMEEQKKRPMIFSRFAGAGSHRYPIGFSGDTVSTWRSLDFQPYFTSTASNIGYGWWSHDIGGHMRGDKDNERLIRWIEYGVFSPVMRIHSSNSPFFNKEPWTLEEPYRGIMKEFMRLRHRLVPYLYTASYDAYTGDRPVIQPLYYGYPDDPASYGCPNSFLFGPSLIVAPVTEPVDKSLRLAAVSCYIPKGRFVDIFTGTVYEGPVKRKLYRPLDRIPVLLKAGGILPEDKEDRENGVKNPSGLKILFGAGDDGSYSLYEDDGESMDYLNGGYVTTDISFKWDEDSCTVTVSPAKGDLLLIPGKRDYEFMICGAGPDKDKADAFIIRDGVKERLYSIDTDGDKNFIKVACDGVDTDKGVIISVEGIHLAENDKKKRVFEILDRAWTDIKIKEDVNAALNESPSDEEFLKKLGTLNVPEILKDAVREFF